MLSTLEVIVLHGECFQIDQITELLGQKACKKLKRQQITKSLSTGADLTCESSAWNGAIVVVISVLVQFVLGVAADVEDFQIDKFAELLGQFSCQKV